MKAKADRPIADNDFNWSDPKFNNRKTTADTIPDGMKDSKMFRSIRRI